MPATPTPDGDPLSEFDPEPKGRMCAPFTVPKDPTLSNALLQFLPEPGLVAGRDRVRAARVPPGLPATHAEGPRDTERFRRAPPPTVPRDTFPVGRVLSAGLSSDRLRSARGPILLIATASVAIVGILLGVRDYYAGTPAATIDMARPARGSDELQLLPTQILSADESLPAVLPETPSMAAPDPLNAAVSIPVAVPTLLPDTAPLPAERTSAASSVNKRAEPAPPTQLGPPAATATRPPQVTSPASLVPPFHGSLAVTSSPEGARVLLNGVLVGVTPLALPDMPIGSRAVRIELEGYTPWSSVVRIVANEPTTAAAELQPSQLQ